MKLDNMDVAEALGGRWSKWEMGCGLETADNTCRSLVAEATKDPSALMKRYPRLTYEAAEAACDRDIRREYDSAHTVSGNVLESETVVLLENIEADIVKKATVPSLAEELGTGTSNGLMASVLEELKVQRLERKLAGLTATDIEPLYRGWDDASDRTEIRLLESAVVGGGLAQQLGLKADPENDAAALMRLKDAVRARRHARVPKELHELRERVAGFRTRQRADMLMMTRAGYGFANRPKEMA